MFGHVLRASLPHIFHVKRHNWNFGVACVPNVNGKLYYWTFEVQPNCAEDLLHASTHASNPRRIVGTKAG